MLRVLIILLPVALAIYALVDLVQTEDGDVQGLPKIAWAAIIVLVAVVGPLAWILAGKRSGRLLSRLLPPEPGTLGPHGARQVPPDDDVDFLRGLRRRPPSRPSTPPPPPAPTPPAPSSPDDLGDELEEFERDLGGGDPGDDDGPDDPPLASR